MEVLSMAGVAILHDPRAGQYFVVCPRCRERLAYGTLDSLHRELKSGDRKCCQGCRAKITFEKNPAVIGLFLDFWHRTGAFPQSTSWLEAVPKAQFILRAEEIRAAFPVEERQGLRRADGRNEGQRNGVRTRRAER